MSTVSVELGRTEYAATEETILRFFEIGLVEWVGITVGDALPFLFAQEVICVACGQRHRWFVLRNEETMCEACSRGLGTRGPAEVAAPVVSGVEP